MRAFDAPEWAQVFVPDASLFESFLRGSVIYLALLVLFRVVLRRQGGSIGVPDIMLVVLLSECVSASLSADAKSVSNGLAAVSALLFWNYTIDRLCCRWPWLQRLLEPKPIQVVKDGKPLRENMEGEGLTDDELKAQLRENGIDDVVKVKAAFVESEGTVSVIPKEGKEPDVQKSPTAVSEPTAPHDPPDENEAIQQFVIAAERLKEVFAGHQQKVAEHKAAAKAVRDLLARHGVRPPRARRDEPGPPTGR